MMKQDLLITDPQALILRQKNKSLHGYYATIYHSRIKNTVIKKIDNIKDGALPWLLLSLIKGSKHRITPRIHKMVVDPREGTYILMEKLYHQKDMGWHLFKNGKLEPDENWSGDIHLSKHSRKVMTELFDELCSLTSMNNPVYWDLHDENVMKRKSGQLVVTDPWGETRIPLYKLNELIEITRIESNKIYVKGQF